MITSLTNDFVKLATSLHHKKGRNQHKLYLAEGIHLVSEALKAKAEIQEYVWTNKLLKSIEGTALFNQLQTIAPGVEVSEAVFNKLAETETPQGIMALIQLPLESKPDFSKLSLGLIADGVQDPGNLGTIIRTAWAAGVDVLFCTSETADPYQGKVIRATMGGIFNLSIFRNLDPTVIFSAAQSAGIQLVAGYPNASLQYYQLDLLKPTIFLVGSEGQGISRVWDEFTINKVNIPQPGQAESLNVAISAGIMIYEAIRQRAINGVL